MYAELAGGGPCSMYPCIEDWGYIGDAIPELIPCGGPWKLMGRPLWWYV